MYIHIYTYVYLPMPGCACSPQLKAHICTRLPQERANWLAQETFSSFPWPMTFCICYLEMQLVCPGFFFFFSPFNSKAGLEKQRYHYSLCKNVSICKRLMKKEKKNLPSFTLTSPTLTPRNVFKQLHLRRAAANALTNSRLTTANTVLMACEDVLQLPHTPRPLGASPAARDPWVTASLPSLVTLHHKDQADSLLLTS